MPAIYVFVAGLLPSVACNLPVVNAFSIENANRPTVAQTRPRASLRGQKCLAATGASPHRSSCCVLELEILWTYLAGWRDYASERVNCQNILITSLSTHLRNQPSQSKATAICSWHGQGVRPASMTQTRIRLATGLASLSPTRPCIHADSMELARDGKSRCKKSIR